VSKRVKSYKKEVTVEGKVGIPGSGIAGKETSTEYEVKDYERALHSLREAKEAIHSMSVDEDFLKAGSFLFASLSEQAKKDMSFFMTGKSDLPIKKYTDGMQAVWIVPFVEEYLREYRKVIDLTRVEWKKNLPFVKDEPLGVAIILSVFKGVMLEFRRRSAGIQFGTIDRPFDRDLTFGKATQRYGLTDGSDFRSLSDDDPEIAWQIIFANEEERYFTLEKARKLASAHALHDLQHYRPASD
jgi:hypothetical protein